VTALTNPRSDRVKSVRALSRRSVRVDTGRFLAEGPQAVREAVRHAAADVVDVYTTAEAAQRFAADIIEPAREAGLFVHEVSEQVLVAMCDTGSPQGIAAVCRVVSGGCPGLPRGPGRAVWRRPRPCRRR